MAFQCHELTGGPGRTLADSAVLMSGRMTLLSSTVQVARVVSRGEVLSVLPVEDRHSHVGTVQKVDLRPMLFTESSLL